MSLVGVYFALAVLCIVLLFILMVPKFFGKKPSAKEQYEDRRRRHSERRVGPNSLSHSDFKNTHSRRDLY